jgi:Mg2+/Co2+ transporter CorB
MLDTQSMLATLAIATAVLTAVTVVLSRIIPDEYDGLQPARRRIEPREMRRTR